jgi:hypothetical protein
MVEQRRPSGGESFQSTVAPRASAVFSGGADG